MKIGEHKQMMKYITRPGTPEQTKRAEENNKKYLADRRAKTLKEYGLDKPLVNNNGKIQTEKEFIKELPIEEQPGYEIDKDPNLLRRIKMYSDNNLGPGFDKAIAEEDKALKKLGRDPMNILQRNNIKKFDNMDSSTYPSNPEQRRKLMAQKKLEKEKPFTKIANNLGKPKQVNPLAQTILRIDPIVSDPYSGMPDPRNERDPVLDELERRVMANKEASYQEKVRNNSTGLRSFDPIKVSRDD